MPRNTNSSGKGWVGHQFKRRFSLQPALFGRDKSDDTAGNHSRMESRSEAGITENSSKRQHEIIGPSHRKVVVMGAAKVGKTSLITQFLYGTFGEKYKRTIEEMHHFNVNGVPLVLDILDTSGSYEFPAMRALSIQSGDVFILVYSILDAETFDQVRSIREEILEAKGNPVPIVVVGNKVDLEDGRKVDFENASAVVTVDWENGFVEASAKENVRVTDIFKELLTQAKLKYNLSPILQRPPTNKRRVSLPSTPAHTATTAIPSASQLRHLETIHEKRCGSSSSSKRNSCFIS